MKKRYILFKTSDWINAKEAKELLEKRALAFFGEWGLSKVVIKIIEFNEEEQMGIILCNRENFNEVLGFLALPSKKRFIALKSSGTLRALKHPS